MISHSWNRNPNRRELHRFGWTMLSGFLVLGLVFWVLAWWRAAGAGTTLSGPRTISVIFWALGVGLLCSSYAPQAVARRVYIVWMTVVTKIGQAVGAFWMSVLYFVFLLPFLLLNLSDPLQLRRRKKASYWLPFEQEQPTIERAKRPF